jgi:hypothetical protein
MKKTIIIISMLASFSALAHQGHDFQPQEKPSEKSISTARSCFKELETLGCGHPREDQEYFVNCYRSNVQMISIDCQSFFETLYGR